MRLGLIAAAVLCCCAKRQGSALAAQGPAAHDAGGAPANDGDAGLPPSADVPDAGSPAGSDADAGSSPVGQTSDGGPSLLPVAPSGWSWENPLPGGASLFGAWAASGDDIWAAGEGTLLHFDGTSWNAAPLPVHASVRAVWGASATDVWAAGLRGALLHFDGSGWSLVSSHTTGPLEVLSGSAYDDVWASSAALPFREQMGLGGANPDAVLVHYDGHSWSVQAISEPTAVFDVARNDVWVGTCGAALHFDGARWSSFAMPGGCVKAIAGLSGGPVFVANETSMSCGNFRNPEIQCASDELLQFDGARFGHVDGPASTALTVSAGQLWGLPSNVWGFPTETLYRFDGRAWVSVASGPSGIPYPSPWAQAIAAGSMNDVWVVGDWGRRMHWDGTSFSAPDAWRTGVIDAIAGSNECDVWAADVRDALLLHRGCNGAWSAVDVVAAGILPPDATSSRRSIYAVVDTAADDIWFANNAGELVHYDGNSWSTEAAPAGGKLIAAARADLWLAADSGLYHRDRSGWTQVIKGRDGTNIGEMFTDVWASGPADVWASGADDRCTSGGTICLTHDMVGMVLQHFDGKTWSTVLNGRMFDVGQIRITGTAPDDVWVTGWGAPRHFDGMQWTDMPGITADLLFAPRRGQVWAMGREPNGLGGLFFFDGKSWTRRFADGGGSFAAAGDILFIYGMGGAILSQPR